MYYFLDIQRILGECLLISSLPSKALRTLVESRGLPSDSTCVLEAEPGKLDIKRLEPCILFISLQAELQPGFELTTAIIVNRIVIPNLGQNITPLNN